MYTSHLIHAVDDTSNEKRACSLSIEFTPTFFYPRIILPSIFFLFFSELPDGLGYNSEAVICLSLCN